MNMKKLTASDIWLLLVLGCGCSVGVVHSWMPISSSTTSSFPAIPARKSPTTTATTTRNAVLATTTISRSRGAVISSSTLLFASPASPAPAEHVDESVSTIFSSLENNEQQQIQSVSSSSSSSTFKDDKKKQKRVAVLVCPAQFCVPNDYTVLLDNLKQHFSQNDNDESSSSSDGSSNNDRYSILSTSSRTTPLSRTDWIKVAKQLPTKEFLQSNLSVPTTLDWYFAKMEEGLAQIFAHESSMNDNDDWSLCIIGHSIGGWVARAYLGGLSQSSTAVHRMALEKCSSLITLGTPHLSSPNNNKDGTITEDNNNLARMLDQTRGLLRAIADNANCSPQALLDNHGIATTCVCGQGLQANLWTSNPEELLALGSYLPLLGRLSTTTQMEDSIDNETGSSSSSKTKNIAGDGIVPIQVAFLEPPARRVLLDTCPRTKQAVRHAHVIPTPWNLWDGTAPSIALNEDEYPSYVSQSIVGQWARYIQ